MKPSDVKEHLRNTKGRENKNFKYAVWLGYEIGINPNLSLTEKEGMLVMLMKRKGKIKD